MSRLLLLSLAVLALAFAPAPLPRRAERVNDSVEIKGLVGLWRTTGLYDPPDPKPKDAAAEGVGHVQITETQWTFVGKQNRVTYDLRIDHDKRPGELVLMRVGTKAPYGRGLIRREGSVLRVIYGWDNRLPTGFEQAGYTVLTLVRD